MISKETVRSRLRDTEGDDFDFEGDVASINAFLESPSSAKVGHFVVAKDYRREGYGSVVFEALLDVLREEEVDQVIVEIQEMDCAGESDPVMDFLRRYGFRYIESFDHYNWGRCVRAVGDPFY